MEMSTDSPGATAGTDTPSAGQPSVSAPTCTKRVPDSHAVAPSFFMRHVFTTVEPGTSGVASVSVTCDTKRAENSSTSGFTNTTGTAALGAGGAATDSTGVGCSSEAWMAACSAASSREGDSDACGPRPPQVRSCLRPRQPPPRPRQRPPQNLRQPASSTVACTGCSNTKTHAKISEAIVGNNQKHTPQRAAAPGATQR